MRYARRLGLFLCAVSLLGCDSEPEFYEEDWPDFSFDARVDRGIGTGDAGMTEADAGTDGTRPDARADAGPTTPDAAAVDDGVEDMPSMADARMPDMAPEPSPINRSMGCGGERPDLRSGQTHRMDFGPEADGERSFVIWVPDGYDEDTPHRLVFAYPGTNWVGNQIRPYLNMEQHSDGGTIFVYLDPLWRDFGDWGFLGGWLLGPEGWNAEGMADLIFTERLMDFVESQYCIDRDRVFATGHSWGGDMAHVVACFLGDRFRAAAPAAANQPYWFGGRQFGEPFCPGETAIWTFFGIEDDHFNVGSAYGDACRDFWLEENACTGVEAHARLDFGPQEQCFEYQGCSANTRYCLYGPEARHQIPSYFSQAVIAWFEGF